MSLHFGNESGKASDAALRPSHRNRRVLFNAYWDYYRGRHKKWIKEPSGETAPENVILNLSRKIVDMSSDFLFGEEVAFEIDDAEGVTTSEEEVLTDLWKNDPFANFSKMDFLQGVALNGCVFGTPFIRIYPQEDGRIRKVNLDPLSVDVIFNPNDKDEVFEYHIVWVGAEDKWLRDRILRVDEENWAIVRQVFDTPVKNDTAASKWMDISEPLMWEFPWAPIFHCQNLKNTRDFWGMSDLEDADLNDTINFITSNTNKIIKYHSHPKTIGFGINNEDINATAIDGFWTIQNEEASVENLEMQSDLSEARQQQADLTSFLHQVSGTPNLDPANVQVGALSGFALRILYGPLLSKTAGKRRRYGNMLSRLNAAMLEIRGVGERVQVSNVWKDPLPVSQIEQSQVFNNLRSGGASVEGAARVAGYSKEQAEQLAPGVNE